MRPILAGGIVLLAVSTSPTMPRAQTPDAAPRVWTGTWEEHFFDEQNFGFTRTQMQVTYRLTEGQDTNGLAIWTSRSVQWSYRSESASFNSVALEERPPDQRGFTMFRFRQDRLTTCTSAGSIELGPSFTTDRLLIPKPDQEAQLEPTCVIDTTNRDTGVTTRTTSKGDRVGFPGIPGDEEFEGCQYNESWRRDLADSYYEGSAHATRAPVVEAVMQVDSAPDSAYARFVPSPGGTLTFTASVPSGAARFRFELDPEGTSHFPGYATNARVDDVFFVKYNLGHLRGRYANDGPDMMFDAEHFGAQEWSRIEPLVVETRIAQGGAVVTVTAMDYGAVGTLRAFVRSEGCGDWLPIPIRIGAETRDAVAIPVDDDNNLMADALEAYRGRDSGADDDAEPKGNGMAGDGLTAFEEYRGFVIRGAACGDVTDPAASTPSGWFDEHMRSAPHHKNLFVHTPDPELIAMLDNFAWSTGLSVHAICESHYVSNDTRVVNFTLQEAGLRTWRGLTISQVEPQHGLWVKPVEELEEGLAGIARPVRADLMGPPKLTTVIEILKPAPVTPPEGMDTRIAAYLRRRGPNPRQLDAVLRHELGHAVGVPHHSDTITDWRIGAGRLNVTTRLSPFQTEGGPPEFELGDIPPPDWLLVEPGPECREEDSNAVYRDGAFTGCLTQTIVRRGQQNSGDDACPMRYGGADGDFYEAPDSTARYLWSNEVVEMGYSNYAGGMVERDRVYVDAWGGRFLRYRIDAERDQLDRFCTRVNGTGINDLPGDRNHAGDAGRDKPCSSYLVVNDVAARGVR
jgi:hypothetical protein